MKLIAKMLVLVLFVYSFVPAAYALENSTAPTSISSSEHLSIQAAQKARGFDSSASQLEILYDGDGEPSYILSYSDDGYLIYDRETALCIESGELNPYKEYPDHVKYYSGILGYYVNRSLDSVEYYSLFQEKTVSEIPCMTIDLSARENQTARGDIANVLSTTDSERILVGSDFYLKRRAFGYNNDNTCTAVATSLALNFIAANNLDSAVVPSNKRFELLTGRATAATVASLYPNANSLHRTLTDRCSMGAVSFGPDVITGVNAYKQLLSEDTDIIVQQLITQATVRSEIDSGRPCLITTTLLSGEYNFHTMVIYGYRLTETGDYEYLVHTGWYSNLVQDSANIYRISETWFSPTSGTNILYRFVI